VALIEVKWLAFTLRRQLLANAAIAAGARRLIAVRGRPAFVVREDQRRSPNPSDVTENSMAAPMEADVLRRRARGEMATLHSCTSP
jgi:hypothetical protein